MSKKTLIKMIATVMAMTMIAGSGLTVFADDLPTGCRKSEHNHSITVDAGTNTLTIQANGENKTIDYECKLSNIITDLNGEHSIPIYNVVISDGITTIGNSSFAVLPSLNKIVIPSSVTTIGNSILNGCHNVVVKFEGTTPPTSISNNAFFGEYTIKFSVPEGTKEAYKTALTGKGKTIDDSSIEEWSTRSSESGSSSCSSSVSSPSSIEAKPTAEQIAEEAAKALEEAIVKEEALPVATFTSTEAVNAIPAEAKTGNSEIFNITSITSTRGFVAAMNKMAKASAAPTMYVYSDRPFAMNAASLDSIVKTGKTFVYIFKYEGHIYKITIPAGAKINMNGQIFMGPLAIGAQLGTTQVVK